MNAKVVVAAMLALGSSAAAIACVLADPPPIVTPPPQEPPHIIRESVTPLPELVFKTNPPCSNLNPDCFVVPVSVDLNASIKWRVFIDLDPTTAPQQFQGDTDDGGVLAVPPDAGPGIRTLSFNPSQNTVFDPAQCHVITFIVAYDFFVDDFAKPLPPGGDSVSWFYQPTNDCTFYDAGALPEGGTD